MHDTQASRPTDAAQFMPFAALTGYYGLVREMEYTGQPRRALTEERAWEVSRMLARLRKGDSVEVVHYHRDAYTTTRGHVRQVDSTFHQLELTSGQRILFEDIWELRWGPDEA